MVSAQPEHDQRRAAEVRRESSRSLQPGPAPASPPRQAGARRKARRRPYWLVALLLVGVAVVGVWRWRAATGKEQPQLETARIDRGRIVAKVTATGTLSAIVTVQVGSQVSGRIQALYADFNSRVKKGQLIARIDPQLFQAAREQARANLVAADGNLAKARAQAVDAQRQAARSDALARQKLVAPADRDTADANSQAAQATAQAALGVVEQARAALHQAEVNLAYTNIVSPTNGVVISRSVDVGQTVAASLQAPTLFVIAEDLAKMQVDTSVAEADVGRLKDGMPVTFTVDAYPSEAFRGVVRQIRNAPQTVQNVVTYDAVIAVANPDLKLFPGMTANVRILTLRAANTLVVPNAVLRLHPSAAVLARAGLPPAQPGRQVVYVMQDGKPEARPVAFGISDGKFTAVTSSGLREGDPVVVMFTTPATSAASSPVPGPGRRGPGF